MTWLALLALVGCRDSEEPVERDCEERIVLYVDADGDGHGDPAQVVLACEVGEGLSESPDDCDDTDPARTTVCDTGDTGHAGDSGTTSTGG